MFAHLLVQFVCVCFSEKMWCFTVWMILANLGTKKQRVANLPMPNARLKLTRLELTINWIILSLECRFKASSVHFMRVFYIGYKSINQIWYILKKTLLFVVKMICRPFSKFLNSHSSGISKERSLTFGRCMRNLES